jgi:hypothetical protein
VRLGWWLVILGGLLAINLWTASQAMEGEPRERVPYSPFFEEQPGRQRGRDHVAKNGDRGHVRSAGE